MAENKESVEDHIDAEQIIESLGCPSLIKAVKNIPIHLWGLSPERLENLIEPTKVTKDLRIAYIAEMQQRLVGGPKITLQGLADRAKCSYPQAHNLLIGQPETLAWVLRPFGEAVIEGRVALLNLIREFSDLSRRPIDDMGKIDYKLLDRKLKFFKLLSDSRIGEEIMAVELARSQAYVSQNDERQPT